MIRTPAAVSQLVLDYVQCVEWEWKHRCQVCWCKYLFHRLKVSVRQIPSEEYKQHLHLKMYSCCSAYASWINHELRVWIDDHVDQQDINSVSFDWWRNLLILYCTCCQSTFCAVKKWNSLLRSDNTVKRVFLLLNDVFSQSHPYFDVIKCTQFVCVCVYMCLVCHVKL